MFMAGKVSHFSVFKLRHSTALVGRPNASPPAWKNNLTLTEQCCVLLYSRRGASIQQLKSLLKKQTSISQIIPVSQLVGAVFGAVVGAPEQYFKQTQMNHRELEVRTKEALSTRSTTILDWVDVCEHSGLHGKGIWNTLKGWRAVTFLNNYF